MIRMTRCMASTRTASAAASTALAAVTSRIEIIAAIKPLLYHPVVLAKMALGVEDISRGRFAINLVNAIVSTAVRERASAAALRPPKVIARSLSLKRI